MILALATHTPITFFYDLNFIELDEFTEIINEVMEENGK
nr:MAG TPA: hypothetical protein [Caudoviricetes sp.]